MPLPPDFGARVRRARQEARLTLKHVAARTHSNLTHLEMVEAGKSTPSAALLAALVRLFGKTALLPDQHNTS